MTTLPLRDARAGGPRPRGRLVALDGLRGLAALVVVVHHSLLTWPSIANQYLAPNRAAASWWLTFTPLHLLWAGTQAVIVFFVLSGIVLTRPYLRRSSAGTWPGYYGRRLVRLYVPAVVALALAGAVVRTFPRRPAPGESWWFQAHAVHVTPGLLAHDALLLDGVSWVDDVLWSLRYEVAFSLALPLVVFAVRRVRRLLWPSLFVAVLLVGLGQLSTNPFAQWMPFFAVGVALAAGWEDVERLAARIEASRIRSLLWAGLCVVAGVLLLADWWFRLALRTGPRDNAVAMSSVAVGAVLLCFLCVGCPPVRRIASGRFLQWAGGISFSLYLVHEPIVVSVSSVVGPGKRGVAETLVVGGAIALAVAVLFHRLVERPSQRWARAAGDRVAAVTGRRPSLVPAPGDDVTTRIGEHVRRGRPPVPRHTAAAPAVRAGSGRPAELPATAMPVPRSSTARAVGPVAEPRPGG